jgi:fibronectin-binding autotransporter adhesin
MENMKTPNRFVPYFPISLRSLSPKWAKRLTMPALASLLWMPAATEVRGATLSWSGGGGGNANWNNSANWGFVGTPGSGDTLIFPASQPNLLNTNNISGLTLNRIAFAGPGGGYDIRGNAFTLTNNIEATNSAGANIIENNIALAATDQVFEVTVSLTLDGILSGSVAVTKLGPGLLLYQGPADNTYSGTTRVNGGTLQLNVGGINAFGGPLIIGDGSGTACTVRLFKSAQLPDAQPVTVNLAGLLDLNNFSDSIGPLTMAGSTVSSGAGLLVLNGDLTVLASTATPQITGNLRFNGSMHVVTIGDSVPFYDLNLYANVSDTGGGLLFTNAAPSGTFARLLGNNSFTGPLIINNITLTGETPTAFGGTSAGTTVGSNGTLWLYQTGITNESLTMAGGATLVGQNGTTWAGPITLNGDVTMDCYPTLSTLEIVGAISGSGGINKIDQGIVRFSGNTGNTYGGNTLVSAGTLELNKVGTPGSGTAVPGPLTLGTNTTVRLFQPWQIYYPPTSLALTTTLNPYSVLDLNGNSDWLAQISLTGGQIKSGAGLLYLSGDITVVSNTNVNSSISGNLQLYAYHTATNNTVNNIGHNFSPDLVISANISSSSTNTLIKDGFGEVDLAGANNTYTGPTLVKAGALWVDYTNGLGNTNFPATVNNGGSLDLNNNVQVGLKPLVLNGNGWAFGALANFGNSTWAGNITLASDSTISSYSIGNIMTLSGAISGPGALITVGAGTVALSGSTANTYGGLTTVSSGTLLLNKPAYSNGAIPGNLDVFGTLRLAANEQIAESADVLLEGGSLFDFGVFFQSIDTLRGSGAITFGVNGYLEVGLNNGTSTYDGSMSGTGYTLGGYTVGKFGSGTFTMNGNNTFANGAEKVFTGGKLVVNGSQPQVTVLVNSGGTFGGSGTVGPINASGAVAPGNSPGVLTSSNLTFTASGNLVVELTGPTAGVGGYDQMNVRGTNALANATLTVIPAFTTPAAIGQTFTIINNDLTDPITGTFSGLPEGAGLSVNGYSFKISYVGGTGNDVVLTLTNLPGALAGTAVSFGNGNGSIDPNECDYLYVVVTNATGTPMTNIMATLSSTSPNVSVTQPVSPYANVPGNGKGTNSTPFQISTTTNFVCGTTVNLQLAVATASHGTFSVPITLTSGGPSLTSVRFDNNITTNVPDVGTIESTNVVGSWSGGPITKVGVSLWLGAPLDSDLTLTLISPSGTSVVLSSGNGAGANFGTGSADASRTTFDDAAGTSITAGTSPFVGSFQPQAPLSALIGTSPVGAWRLRIQDTGFFSLPDTLRNWSLFLYGTTCAAGSGLCLLCPNDMITGALGLGSAIQTNYCNFNGTPSTCGVPKVCPGTITGGLVPCDDYIFQNGPSDACITVTVEDDAPVNAMLATVYSGSYNPANSDKCVNYLADGGNIIQPSNPVQAFSFNVSSNATFVVNLIANVFSPVTPYKLWVSGGDCRPILNITPTGANKVQFDWTTAGAGFGLEGTNVLVTGATNWPPVTNVPVIVNSRFTVTNVPSVGNEFYRLHKAY